MLSVVPSSDPPHESVPPHGAEIDAAEALQARLRVVLAGRFELLGTVGVGGMATVYAARHRSHGAIFAIKLLREEFAADHAILTRFRREALHAACLLGHPNIVSVLEVEEADGLHFLVMPYVRGEDLDALLARTGPLPVEEALQATLHVVSALEFAARKEILHGDLTPGNIRLSEFGRYMVLDFGLSRALGTRARRFEAEAGVLGTPYYMAPEQIRGEATDIRSDLYSVGAILYEMVTGRPPFVADTLKEIARQHLEQAPVIPPAVRAKAPAVTGILRRLLEKGSDARFQTHAEVRESLLAAGARTDASTLTPKMDGQEEVRPPRRRLEQ